jgi:RES domain
VTLRYARMSSPVGAGDSRLDGMSRRPPHSHRGSTLVGDHIVAPIGSVPLRRCGVPPPHILKATSAPCPAVAIPRVASVRLPPCGGQPLKKSVIDSRRRAWYAGVDLETSIDEVAFHRLRFLKDGRISERLSFDYADFLADFSGQFHFLDDSEREQCLQPGPIPQCYGPSQALANSPLYSGSRGVVYPSVRHPGRASIAGFRPALVFHPRRAKLCGITVASGDDRIENRELTRSLAWHSDAYLIRGRQQLEHGSRRARSFR